MQKCNTSFSLILLAFALTFLAPQCLAQGSSFIKGFKESASSDTTTKKSLRAEVGLELTLEQKKMDLEIKKADYLMKSLDHRQKVFSWQHTASIIIFFVVIIIVVAGLVLSVMHFYKDLHAAAGTEKGTEIEVGPKGLKINSSIIGLLILALSIAFLYMYLIYVFPINELSVDNSVSR